MKTKNVLLSLSVLLFTCCTNNKANEKKNLIPKKSISKPKFETLSAISVIGDFNGDKIIDTLTEMHSSGNPKDVLTNVPFFNDYDSTVVYFHKNNIQTSIQSNYESNIPALELGMSFGVECLINIGDNNKDGKDELALVIDYCDFSMMNSCKIYSICDSKWKMLNHFAIHENAFIHEKNEKSKPNHIEGYLEKKEEKWFYADAWEVLNADDTLTKMKPLKINKCN